MAELQKGHGAISDAIRERLADYQGNETEKNIGRVISSGDGIVKIAGLMDCKYGELLEFEDMNYGLALNLEDQSVGAVLFGEGTKVVQGSVVMGTGRVVEVPVGEKLIGRVVNPLGQPLDAMGPIETHTYRPIESPAPGIVERSPVNKPLMTGLLAIDSMTAIGRGQRELIIGDRQTGKTAIAVDTILNQKGKDVVCIYVGIGQKASTMANVIGTFKDAGAMAYTIVVSATASDSAPLQYIAPYAGCAMAEELMHQGRDVLIVYDDLSKHAVAYRAMSLLLHRPPGREAYPGDVFYLHSRLLERAAKLREDLGGGSITALPIIETMAGDISAYVPTNVISITDGQIFLETDLFHAGVRPAVNVGLSVSRVGGAAQSKAMRRVAGHLRLDLAQYRELAVFAQFGSDLDPATQEILDHGERLTEVLKQDQYKPLPLAEQVVLLYAVDKGLMRKLKLKEIQDYKKALLRHMEDEHDDLLKVIETVGDLSEETADSLKLAVESFNKGYLKEDEDE